MTYSSDWKLVASIPKQNSDSLFITAKDDTFIITNLSSFTEKKISRENLVGNFKYPCEILSILQKDFHGFEKKNKFIDETASNLIEQICEANRLLF